MIDGDIQKEIREMREKGSSISRIARELGLSRPTVLKYLYDHSAPRVSQHTSPSIGKRVIPVDRPSQKVIDQREDVEIVDLEVEKQKSLKELEKVTGPKEHPALVEKRARVEIVNLDLDEYEAQKKLEARKKEEMQKAQAEEEARIAREREQEQLAEERSRLADREKWIEEYQNKALTWWLPRGISITTTLRFQIKDEIKKALVNRSEDEDQWEIERLVRETVNIIIQPFLDEQKARRKLQLIQLQVLPKVEPYIRSAGLGAHVDAETQEKAKEYVYDHFMKTLTGNELIIPSHQVTELLNNFFRPIKEKVRGIQEEQERQAREKREAEERGFWENMKKKREKEEIGSLLEIGMNRFNYYLLANRKELGVIGAKEQERARRHLERELREEVEGNETDEEVEKMTDEILDRFFFE